MMRTLDTNIQQQLESEIEKSHYKAQRYSQKFTFALLEYEGKLPKEVLQKFLRLSDFILEVKEGFYFINFYNTDEINALKAAENLIYQLDSYLQNQKSYIAIDRLDTKESATSTLNRLYQILQEAKKHNSNRVEDEQILNELY
jgi:hypothetical protein